MVRYVSEICLKCENYKGFDDIGYIRCGMKKGWCGIKKNGMMFVILKDGELVRV